MATASARIARSAHNVANVNTPGFHASQVEAVAPTETRPPDPKSMMTGAYHGEVGVSSTDLALESVQQINAVHAFKANLEMLRVDDERTRRLLDLKA